MRAVGHQNDLGEEFKFPETASDDATFSDFGGYGSESSDASGDLSQEADAGVE